MKSKKEKKKERRKKGGEYEEKMVQYTLSFYIVLATI